MKFWYYISAWKKAEGGTWGSAASSWKQVSGYGPMLMTQWQANAWGQSELGKFPHATVLVWRWTGAQWVQEAVYP